MPNTKELRASQARPFGCEFSWDIGLAANEDVRIPLTREFGAASLEALTRNYPGPDLPLSDWFRLDVRGETLCGIAGSIGIYDQAKNVHRRFEECLAVTVGSLVLADEQNYRGVSYSRRKVYWSLPVGYGKRPFGLKVLLFVLKMLAKKGLIVDHPATVGSRGTRSWFELTRFGRQWLASIVPASDIQLTSRALTLGDPSPLWVRDRETKIPVKYHMTADKRAILADLQETNGLIKEVEVRFDPRDVEREDDFSITLAAGLKPDGTNGGYVIIRKTDGRLGHWVRQIWNDLEMTLGGRLYGPLSNVPKGPRSRMQFHVDGEWHSLTEIDVKGCHIALLYHHAGMAPPADPYEIEGLTRSEAKRVGVIAVGSRKRRGSINALADEYKEDREKSASNFVPLKAGKRRPRTKPKRIDYERAKLGLKLFEAAHRPIVQYLHADQGIRLQATEGRANLETIYRLAKMGIPILPLHDGIHVPDFAAEIALEIFKAALQESSGNAKLEVLIKRKS